MNQNLKTQFDDLANRGTPRGAELVLERAMSEAAVLKSEHSTRKVDLMSKDLTTIQLDDGGSVVAVETRPAARKASRSQRSIAGFGIAALLGVGGYATFALQGDGGGASSPIAAVEQLANAIENEDILAAVDVLAPKEVGAISDLVRKAADKAKQLDVVKESSDPLHGLDVDVNDLTLESEDLAPTVAKVTITGGMIESSVDADELENAVDGIGIETIDDETKELAGAGFEGADAFIMVIKEDDGWYVSPAYTAMETIRVATDGPVADFGSADPSKLGAATPEAAVQDGIEAFRTNDWERIIELMPPGELPVWEYREMILDSWAEIVAENEDYFEGQTNFTADSLDVTAEVHGDRATVSVTGTFSSGNDSDSDTDTYVDEYDDEYDNSEWDDEHEAFIDGNCVAHEEGLTIVSPDGSSPDSCWGGNPVVMVFEVLVSFIASFGEDSDDLPTFVDNSAGPLTLELVQDGGRWFISPITTVTVGISELIDRIDQDDIESWTSQEDDGSEDSETTHAESNHVFDGGTITLNQEVGGNEGNWVFEFAGTAGSEVIIEISDGQSDGKEVTLYGPDREPKFIQNFEHGNTATLEEDGTYRLEFTAYDESFSLTIWNANKAPKDLLAAIAQEISDPARVAEIHDKILTEFADMWESDSDYSLFQARRLAVVVFVDSEGNPMLSVEENIDTGERTVTEMD